jgi:hypothetical protein
MGTTDRTSCEGSLPDVALREKPLRDVSTAPRRNFAFGRLEKRRPGLFETEPASKRSVPVCRTCFAKRLDALPDPLEAKSAEGKRFKRLSQSAELPAEQKPSGKFTAQLQHTVVGRILKIENGLFRAARLWRNAT